MDPMADLGLSMDPTTRDRHAYAGRNPIGYVDTDGHRYYVDTKGGGRVEYMPNGSGGGTRMEHGRGSCGCTETQSGTGTGTVRIGTDSFVGTSGQVRRTVKNLRANSVSASELTLGDAMDGCSSPSLNECHDRAKDRKFAEGQEAIGSILAGSGMHYASDGLSVMERNLLFDAWAAEQGYIKGTPASIHGNASLAQMGRLGLLAAGPFVDFGDGALYSWNKNTGMSPVSRAAWAFNTGAASAAGGAAGGAGGNWACRRAAQSFGYGPGKVVRLAGAVCAGGGAFAGSEGGKRVVG